MELTKEQENYLAFLQDQLEIREDGAWTKERNGNRHGKDQKLVTEWMILNMCWNEYVRVHLGLYPSLNAKEFTALWKQIKKYRASLLPTLKRRVSEKVK
jgi:hypothetical protein